MVGFNKRGMNSVEPKSQDQKMSSPDHAFAVIALTDNVAKYMGALYFQSKNPTLIVLVPMGWYGGQMLCCSQSYSDCIEQPT